MMVETDGIKSIPAGGVYLQAEYQNVDTGKSKRKDPRPSGRSEPYSSAEMPLKSLNVLFQSIRRYDTKGNEMNESVQGVRSQQ